jgi:chromosome segregation ATPase
VLHRLSEKQARTIETLNDAQRSLGSKLDSAEKELTLQQSVVLAHQKKIDELNREKSEASTREQGQLAQNGSLTFMLNERSTKLEAEENTRKRLEERVNKLERDLSSARTSAVAFHGADGSDKALRKTNEQLNVSCVVDLDSTPRMFLH